MTNSNTPSQPIESEVQSQATSRVNQTAGHKLKIGVLISGSGTNLQAIIDEILSGRLDVEISLVISSRPDAYGLVRASNVGIPTLSLSKDLYKDPSVANSVIASELHKARVDYVVMAGYMRMLTQEVLAMFPGRILNLHPALLPAFKGAHAIKDAFEYGVKVTGVTVHFADATYDTGAIIAQEAVEVREDDTLDTLEERIHKVEHRIYPKVLSWLVDGRVELLDDRRVVIKEA